MRIDIISAVPEQLSSPLDTSIIHRGREKGLVEILVHNLRDHTPYKHGQIDDYPFGGGAGMVLMPEPLSRCIESLTSEREYDEIIYLTPDGQTLQQNLANQLSLRKNLILIAGHYKGIDQRIRDKYVTMEISIGDYVLSGGELPALILTDAIVRLIPGVLGDIESALTDSFQDSLLDPPVYTRPSKWQEIEIPEVLLSGHEAKIREWRMEESMKKTQNRRPDLWEKFQPEKE